MSCSGPLQHARPLWSILAIAEGAMAARVPSVAPRSNDAKLSKKNNHSGKVLASSEKNWCSAITRARGSMGLP